MTASAKSLQWGVGDASAVRQTQWRQASTVVADCCYGFIPHILKDTQDFSQHTAKSSTADQERGPTYPFPRELTKVYHQPWAQGVHTMLRVPLASLGSHFQHKLYFWPISNSCIGIQATPQVYSHHWGVGIAQWLEWQTHDWNVVGSNPCRSSSRIFFSMVNFLCWLLFQYLYHHRVTAVARKRSWSFCQKCRWQVTAKHAYTLCMWLCMKWHDAWLDGVHRTCAETAAVSCGTSHASAVNTPLWWIFKNAL